MFEPFLASEALAAAGDLPAHGGQFPILELFGGIISLIVVGLGALGYRNATPPPAPAKPSTDVPPGGAETGVHLYFGGPLQKIFDQNVDLIGRFDKLMAADVETREAMAEAIRLTRHDIRNAIHESGLDTEGQLNALGQKLDTLNNLLVRLDEFARNSLRK